MTGPAQIGHSESVSDEKEVKGPENNNGHSESDSEGAEAQGVNEAALLRKLDGRLLPAVGILYLLSFLDRSNGK